MASAGRVRGGHADDHASSSRGLLCALTFAVPLHRCEGSGIPAAFDWSLPTGWNLSRHDIQPVQAHATEPAPLGVTTTAATWPKSGAGRPDLNREPLYDKALQWGPQGPSESVKARVFRNFRSMGAARAPPPVTPS